MNDLIKYLKYVGDGLDETFKIKGKKIILSQKETDIQLDKFICKSFYNINSINTKFGLILGNFPLGLAKKEWSSLGVSMNITERENWLYIFKSALLLNELGFGVFPIEPSFFESDMSLKFRKLLIDAGFKIEIVLNLPKSTLQPESALRPYLLIISRGKQKEYFVAEIIGHALDSIMCAQISNIIKNKYNKSSSTLRNGIIIKEFEGFNKYKIKKEIEFLEKEYCLFNKVFFKEIITNLMIGKSTLETNNSLFISKSGEIYDSFEVDKIKSSGSIKDYAQGNIYFSYARVDFNKTKCLAEYMKLFLKSRLGKKLLDYLKSCSIAPRIDIKKITTLQIPLPDLSFQNKIIDLSKKMQLLNKKTTEFIQDVTLNPSNYEKLEPNINQMLDSLNMLSEEDKILETIKNGEDEQTEFKSSLRKSIEKENIPDKVIEKNVLKAIAGLLNAKGGCLIIGVNDKQQIIGLEKDEFASKDDILKHLSNIIRRDIDIKFIDLITYKIITINKKDIIIITCEASVSPVFLGKSEEFYVRTSPSTIPLAGKKLYEYIQNHFGEKK